MRRFIDALREVWARSEKTNLTKAVCTAAVLSVICVAAPGQSPAPEQAPPAPASPAPSSPTQAAPETAPSSPVQETQPASTPSAPATQSESHAPNNLVLTQGAFRIQTAGGEIKEDQLKQMLVGKTLYLRAGYQDNTLEFDEKGQLLSHSPKGSFTLSQIQINKVKLSKHKIQLEGDRYALHFLGAAPYEDPTKATDRVKINPKKKSVRISFERQEVEKPKKKDKSEKHKHHAKSSDAEKETAASQPSPENTVDAANPVTPASATPASAPTPAPADHPSDKKGTLAASQAQASQLLLSALDTVFSVGVDERMIAAMPEFWKLYYQAAAAKTDYTPTDPGVLRQNAVDQKARLISAVDPPSNEFAQANGVAGIALYHAVIGSDGKVEEVVAGRPIGFGLDESAEQTIRKANFQPATKDGKPVPVALDVVVSFRIYSKRTSQPGAPDQSQKPSLPGPYTVETTAASPTAPPPATPPQ